MMAGGFFREETMSREYATAVAAKQLGVSEEDAAQVVALLSDEDVCDLTDSARQGAMHVVRRILQIPDDTSDLPSSVERLQIAVGDQPVEIGGVPVLVEHVGYLNRGGIERVPVVTLVLESQSETKVATKESRDDTEVTD